MKPAADHESEVCSYCDLSGMCDQSSSAEDCEARKSLGGVIHLRRREQLYAYRDQFKSLFAVQRGAVKSFYIDVNGQEHIHQFFLPGEIIGLEAVYLGYYPNSASAIGASVVCELAFDSLLERIAKEPLMQKQMLNAFSRRMNIGKHDATVSAEQQLAGFLFDILARLRATEVMEFELPMSRYDIGNFLGLAPETTSRIFTRFQQAKLILVQNKKIKIIDPVKLRWIAEDGIRHPLRCDGSGRRFR